MRWVYISPHLDDAILSAGGLIWEQVRAGFDVQIWTVLSGFPSGELSPFAQLLHQQWGIDAAADLIRARRAEDLNAANLVGASPLHLDFLDCIYRRGKNGDPLYIDIFVPPHEDEADLPAQIADIISARLAPDDEVVCPLGIGSHVDHVLVRRAVERLSRPIFYYADVPYLFKSPREAEEKTATLKKHLYEVSAEGVRSWQDAIACYASQLGSLFESPEAMRAQIQAYWATDRGISLWRAA